MPATAAGSASMMALASELFVNGSLNTFAQKTNVDTRSRIIAYNIRELGEQLMPIGILVTLDTIFNRVLQNWRKGRTTWIFVDECYLLFREYRTIREQPSEGFVIQADDHYARRIPAGRPA